MSTISVRDFRSNMAASFDKSDAGEQVLVRRGKRIYAIVPLLDNDLVITPELQAKIDKARKEYKEGKAISCNGHQELDTYLKSL